jgi:hypothetical protein
MISSPGCQCLIAGASGSISTRSVLDHLAAGRAQVVALQVGARETWYLLGGHG